MTKTKTVVTIAVGLVALLALTTPAAASPIETPSPSDIVDGVSEVRDEFSSSDNEDSTDRMLEESADSLETVEDGIEESSGPSEHTVRTAAGCAMGGLAAAPGGPKAAALGCTAVVVAP